MEKEKRYSQNTETIILYGAPVNYNNNINIGYNPSEWMFPILHDNLKG
jgi:hypothetical protein